jgi:uncharacterized membrane protein SpoIIM required for sporulation
MKRKEKVLDFRKQFGEAEAYLKESQYYIYFAFLVFVIAVLVGFVWAEQFGFIDELLRGIVELTIGMNGFELIFFILQNNLQSALYAFLGGIFFGVLPLINAIVNGVVLGYVAERVVSEVGAGQLVGLFPHGIFELPAIFISLGMGVKLGFLFVVNYLKYWREKVNTALFIIMILVGIFAPLIVIIIPLVLVKGTWQEFKRRFFEGANVFLFVVVPLLIIAAIIEGVLIALL